MKIDTIDNKLIINKTGQQGGNMLDFAEPTYVPDYNSSDFVVTRTIIVSNEYNMRPDLLSFALYGTDDYVDIILKINEISSPLSLRTGDLIIVPAIQQAQNFYIFPQREELIEAAKVDNTKKSRTDQNRMQALARISSGISNGSTAALPTNQLQPGEENLDIKNGGINL